MPSAAAICDQAASASDRVPSRTASAESPAVLRQTQGLIGLVIVGGAAAAYFVNIAWLIAPAFVGVGLLVAALTGVCPMALLIARLPWNRTAGRTSGCACGNRA